MAVAGRGGAGGLQGLWGDMAAEEEAGGCQHLRPAVRWPPSPRFLGGIGGGGGAAGGGVHPVVRVWRYPHVPTA